MVSEIDVSVCKSAVKLFIEFACVFFASGSDIFVVNSFLTLLHCFQLCLLFLYSVV